MSPALQGLAGQAVNGLVLGSIYALQAAGLALVFGVARLVNFAHGSVFMAGSYAGWFLLSRLGWPLWAALPGAAAAGALIGLAIERLAVRPFRGSARVAPLLATIGAGMVLDSLAEIVFTPNPQSFPSVVPAGRLELGGVSLGFLDLLIVAASAASAAGLFAALRWSRAGRALRAAAQDPEAALQMGVRVDAAGALAFALASALGALAGILVGLYYNFVSPSSGLQAGLKSFAACVLGGLGSVPASMAGGLLLGMAESFGVAAFGSSARNLISYGILVAALVLRPNGVFGGRGSPEREAPAGAFLPIGKALRPKRPVALALALAAFALPFALRDPYVLQVLTNAWIAALFAASLGLVAGTAGVVSLGQAGLMAIGGYASALLSLRWLWPFPLAFLAAGLVSAALGTLLAAPALRLKGHYASIATLALGEVVSQVILLWDRLTRGPLGIAGVPSPRIFGLDVIEPRAWYWLSLSVLALGVAAMLAITESPLGRTLRALREDEAAAAAFGVKPLSYRSLAFAVGAFFAGLAGSLTAHMYGYIDHQTFGGSQSLLGLTMAILGGLGNVWGAVVGALALTCLPELLRFAAGERALAYGLVLLVVLRWRPRGLLGSR